MVIKNERGQILSRQGEMGENTTFTRKCRKKVCKRPRDRLSGHNTIRGREGQLLQFDFSILLNI